MLLIERRLEVDILGRFCIDMYSELVKYHGFGELVDRFGMKGAESLKATLDRNYIKANDNILIPVRYAIAEINNEDFADVENMTSYFRDEMFKLHLPRSLWYMPSTMLEKVNEGDEITYEFQLKSPGGLITMEHVLWINIRMRLEADQKGLNKYSSDNEIIPGIQYAYQRLFMDPVPDEV